MCCFESFIFFFFNDTATTEIYTLSLHDALPICRAKGQDETSDLRRDLQLLLGHGDVGGEGRVARARRESRDDARSDPAPEHTWRQTAEQAYQQGEAHGPVKQQPEQHDQDVFGEALQNPPAEYRGGEEDQAEQIGRASCRERV